MSDVRFRSEIQRDEIAPSVLTECHVSTSVPEADDLVRPLRGVEISLGE